MADERSMGRHRLCFACPACGTGPWSRSWSWSWSRSARRLSCVTQLGRCRWSHAVQRRWRMRTTCPYRLAPQASPLTPTTSQPTGLPSDSVAFHGGFGLVSLYGIRKVSSTPHDRAPMGPSTRLQGGHASMPFNATRRSLRVCLPTCRAMLRGWRSRRACLPACRPALREWWSLRV